MWYILSRFVLSCVFANKNTSVLVVCISLAGSCSLVGFQLRCGLRHPESGFVLGEEDKRSIPELVGWAVLTEVDKRGRTGGKGERYLDRRNPRPP